MPPLSRLASRLSSFWLYALLAGGSLVFMWPFLWMAAASVKLDRELFAEDAGLMPARPIPRAASPYLETRRLDGYGHPRLAAVRPAIEAAECHLRYLPPYSPDFNPIEQVFSTLKARLRASASRTFETLVTAIGAALDATTPEHLANCYRHCGYKLPKP